MARYNRIKPLVLEHSGLGKFKWRTLKRLNTPEKIQDFINRLPFNFEKRGETYMSVARSLKTGRIHCFEGALIAAAALWIQGERPLLLDLKPDKSDIDHVVALFRRNGFWGAISKTNHAVLRYREPVYKSIRELAMSYFHEYFLNNGKKTLRSYSRPFNLRGRKGWLAGEEELFGLVDALDNSPHIKLLDTRQVKGLRRAEPIEIKAGMIQEYKG